jgi:hypothetical protein
MSGLDRCGRASLLLAEADDGSAPMPTCYSLANKSQHKAGSS